MLSPRYSRIMAADQARPADTKGELRIVVVGAGFAGLTAIDALGKRASPRRRRRIELADTRVRVTLVDRNSYSTVQPLLDHVATAGLTPAACAHPRWTARRKTRAGFRKGA